ncbi:hypothetical protein BASA83_006007 [Batrachochytrium salamandrivorans]|nr:hypothetical protein BASA83_006007 [Batrachochytrium salamandrivorans]
MLPFDRSFYGLSSEIKDSLVHFDNPSSVSAAMDMAIRIDNRLFERRQEQRLNHQQPSSSNSSANSVTFHFRNQQQQLKFFEPKSATPNRSDSFINLPSARPMQKLNNHMDIDFIRRGPLSSMEREHRMKHELCLFVGELAIERQLAPSPGSSLIQIYPGISTQSRQNP